MTRRTRVTAICTLTLLALVAGAMPASCDNNAGARPPRQPRAEKGISDTFNVYINGVLNTAEIKLWKDQNKQQLGYDYSCPAGTTRQSPANATYYIEVVGYSPLTMVAITANLQRVDLYRP